MMLAEQKKEVLVRMFSIVDSKPRSPEEVKGWFGGLLWERMRAGNHIMGRALDWSEGRLFRQLVEDHRTTAEQKYDLFCLAHSMEDALKKRRDSLGSY